MANSNGGGAKPPAKKTAPDAPEANVRLREKKEPLTVDGKVNVGDEKKPLRLPSRKSQEAGFYMETADLKRLLAIAGDRYEKTDANGGK